jgi:hypothetical protein
VRLILLLAYDTLGALPTLHQETVFVSRRPKQDRQSRPERKPLSERISVWVGTIVALATLIIAALTLRNTLSGSAEEEGLQRAKIVVDAAELGKDNPHVLEPVAEVLENGGQPEAAGALRAVVKVMHEGRSVPKPVMLREDPDSTEVELSRIERRVTLQPAVQPGLIALRLPTGNDAPIRMEIIAVPRDSAAATLASGERVERRSLGGLIEDEHGTVYCGGPCKPGQFCCRHTVGP